MAQIRRWREIPVLRGVAKRPVHDLRAVVAIPVRYKNWPTVLRHFRQVQGYSRGTRGAYVLIRLRDGSEFVVRAGTIDLEILHDVYAEESYAVPGCQVEPTDTIVIDVGAHIGSFAVHAARRMRSGRVFSFEPDRENFAVLEENIRRNRLQNVFASPEGVADRSGTATLYCSGVRNCDHTLDAQHAPPGSDTSVAVTTLPEVFARHSLTHAISSSSTARDMSTPFSTASRRASSKRSARSRSNTTRPMGGSSHSSFGGRGSLSTSVRKHPIWG